MATAKARAEQKTSQKRVQAGQQPSVQEKPVALTLKLDGKTYIRLSTLRATQRRTHQDIMREAVEQYLDRAGV
jgi:hypothetical protein